MVNAFRLLRERRGILTVAQIRRMSRLLAARAEELYRRADRVERGDAAARLPRALSLTALARRVAQVGQIDDPVTQSATVRGTRSLPDDDPAGGDRGPAPGRGRGGHTRLATLAPLAAPSRRPAPRPRGGRHPNVPLDTLLRYAARHGISDAELADELNRQRVRPDGPGSERTPRHRWMAILKSARARRRRTT